MGSTPLGAGRFGSGFFESMREDRLGMRCGPAVGQHLLQTQVVGMQAEKKVTDVAPRFDPMTLRTGENCAQHSRTRTGRFAALGMPSLSRSTQR